MHIAIFLFGFTAILGKLITLKEIPLVWNRLWVAVLGLVILPGVLRGITRISIQNLLRFSGIGLIVALHWITFYGSIKLGNSASITLACLATTSLFTSFLEPMITKSKFNWIELVLGLLVIVGIILLTGVGSLYYKAIAVGLISALLAACFSVLNKKYIKDQNTISVSVVELLSGFILISICIPIVNTFIPQTHWIPQKTDWLWIAVLGIFCTSIAYVLSLNSLKELSAFVANLSINLEPVYGIILAALIFNESQDLNTSFYLGTSIILLAVLLHPVIQKIQKHKRKRGIVQ